MNALELIQQERQRQIEVKGYDSVHDDKHRSDVLVWAAACYCLANIIKPSFLLDNFWPFSPEYFKPSPDNRLKELVKAGALVVAELERELRKQETKSNE